MYSKDGFEIHVLISDPRYIGTNDQINVYIKSQVSLFNYRMSTLSFQTYNKQILSSGTLHQSPLGNNIPWLISLKEIFQSHSFIASSLLCRLGKHGITVSHPVRGDSSSAPPRSTQHIIEGLISRCTTLTAHTLPNSVQCFLMYL